MVFPVAHRTTQGPEPIWDPGRGQRAYPNPSRKLEAQRKANLLQRHGGRALSRTELPGTTIQRACPERGFYRKAWHGHGTRGKELLFVPEVTHTLKAMEGSDDGAGDDALSLVSQLCLTE